LIDELRPVEAAYAHLFETLPPLSEVKGTLDLTANPPKASTLSALTDLGFQDPAAAVAVVHAWQEGRSGGLRAREARERVAELAPALLDAMSRT
ncbi:hypothetical protein, partial [Acinetobacter baumannii]|uniref:hypothetical protein n=1 Tax=Acinetobacter baumannii TaxID=470 RepID=UPI0013D77D9E